MANITIHFKDGTTRRFLHEGRSGGSFTKTIRYEGQVAIITDEWGVETAYPVQDIREVVVEPHRSW